MACVTIDLPPDAERTLRESATRNGQSLEEYLRHIAVQAASPTKTPQPQRAGFKALTGGIASAVAAEGLTDDEVEGFFEEAVKQVREERRIGKQP